MRARTAFHPRTAIAAIAGILAIVGASILGGALAASASADSVTITTANNSVTTFGTATINGEITWAGAGGSIVVQVVNADGVAASFCTGSSYLATDTTWGCGGVNLSMGVNTITAIADDGAGTVTSNTITYTRGGSDDPTITENNVSFQSTTLVMIHGTGPEMGTINLFGYVTSQGSSFTGQYCTATLVDRFGDWSCVLSVATLDRYSFYAVGFDILGNQTFDSPTVQLAFVPAKPGLTVDAQPTGITVEGTKAADGNAVGLFVDHWNAAGVSDAPRVYCPAGWGYSGPLPTNGVEGCNLGTPVAGSYLVSSNSFTNDAYSTNRGDLIRIPNTPVLVTATPEADGTVTFAGTQSALWTGPFATADGGTVVTVETVGGLDICTGTGDAGNNFSCNGAAPSGAQTFRAYATSYNFQGSPASLDGYYDGSSVYSNTQSALVINGQHVQITSPTNGSSQAWVAGPNLTISGTTQLAVPIDVAVDGSVPFQCATLMPAAGTWSCTVVASPGSHTLVASQAGGLDSNPVTVTLTTPPLIKPTISCAFTPGGGASVTSAQFVDTRVYKLQAGTGDPAVEPGVCNGNSGNPITNLGPFVPAIQFCAPTCSLTLTPGTYYAYYAFSDSVGVGYDFDSYNYFFTVPDAPEVAKVTDTGRASGTGTPGDRIRLLNASGTQICSVVVSGSGTWNCTVTLPSSQSTARAYQLDAASGAMSAYSAAVTLPALEVVAPTPTPRPWSISFGGGTEFHPGDPVVIEGTDAPPGAQIDAELHSTPVLLGSTTADALGAFSLTTTIPMDAEPGAHTIVVIATPTDGSAPVEFEQPVTVIGDPLPEEEAATGSGPAPTGVSPRQQPGGVSALGAGLVSPAEILGDPVALATAGSLGLALVLLVLVPAEFFGEALANHYGTLGGFFTRRQRLKRVFERVGNWIEENRFLAGAALVFVTSVVFCFVDPGFGFDLTSLRLLLSCAASILLVNFLSAGITERVAEKAWKVPTRLEVMPWGLAIAIVGVIASRVLNFSPGFLIGSIIGVSVIGEVSKKLETRVILLWSTVVWGVAMVSWVLAPLVPTLPVADPAAFLTSLLSDSLTATAAAGLTALLVALLPIALFDGGVLFKNSKLRWALAFGLAVASFSIVVLPSASNWLGLGDGLLTWLLLTLAFIAVAIITYALAVRRNRVGGSRLVKARTEA